VSHVTQKGFDIESLNLTGRLLSIFSFSPGVSLVSRAITLKTLKISRRKYPGAQQHMLINIPVKFHDSRSNTFQLVHA
jgi:Tfp pilus assembly protein PilO